MSGTPTDAQRIERAFWDCEHGEEGLCEECTVRLVALVRAEATEAAQREMEKAAQLEADCAVAAEDTINALRAERDAALAQMADLRVKLEEAQAFNVKEAFAEHDRLSALLAQREAEVAREVQRADYFISEHGKALGKVAVLQEMLERAPDVETVRDSMKNYAQWLFRARELGWAGSLLDAALAYATTLKAEGAREERERNERVIKSHFRDSRERDDCLAAIRAHRADPEEGKGLARPPTPPEKRPWPTLRRANAETFCPAEYARLLELFHEADLGPRVIAGVPEILAYLNGPPPGGLGMRRLNGDPIRYRMVKRWAALEGFPLLPGMGRSMRKGGTYRPITLQRAVDAWVLSRKRNGMRGLFVMGWWRWKERAGTPSDPPSEPPATA